MKVLHHIAVIGKATGFIVPVLLAAAIAGAISSAQAQRAGGPTPSGPGAEVYFIDLGPPSFVGRHPASPPR
jgi:hypothetical protein